MSKVIKLINGIGVLNPDIAIVGEAPGAEEETQGKPFVGRSGRLIDRIMEKVGLDRSNCYITNVVKFRPKRNKTPTDKEILEWQEYLATELTYVSPKLIITLGVVPFKAVNGYFPSLHKNEFKITENHGQILESSIARNKTIAPYYFSYLPTFHPAYCLRNPKVTQKLEDDFKKAVEHVRRKR